MAGVVTDWQDYYAYGAARDSWSLVSGRWQYLGKEFDNETATLNLEAREYDPFVGFTQLDPLWAKYPSLSGFTYGAQNPFMFADPTGRKIEIIEKDGKYTIKLTGRLINESRENLTTEQLVNNCKNNLRCNQPCI